VGMMSKKSPQLRFEGFTDDWEVRKLTDVTYSYSGLTYSPTDVQDKGTFVLRSSNVKNDQLIDADNVYVNPDIVNSNNVKVGDVIVVVRNGSRSLIGKHAIVTKEMPHTVIGAFMSAFRGENGDYINALLSTNNFQKEVHKSLGATINQITGKDFSMMNFLTPKLEEQNKIGSFFKQLDNTIALHQRKLDLLKEQKKGYLQKMFPKNGAKVPELRFAGFADDWELHKLGELSQKISVGIATSSSKHFSSQDQGVPFIKNQDIKENRINTKNLEYISKEFDNKNKNKRVRQGDIITARTGYPGLSAVVPKELEGAQTFTTLITRPISEIILSEYISIFINSPYGMKQISGMEAGGAQKNVNAGILQNLLIPLPSLDEQKQISNFVLKLDNTITLHQRKLDLLKEQKKGFFQKMFV